MKIEALRKLAGQEWVDYAFVMNALNGYACPRDKISAWLASGELIRIKKGLYIFGESVALQPYSHEALANIVYGPSAVSMRYALNYYGLIPERVTQITSITNKRVKFFSTPIGAFQYYYLHPKKYPVGVIVNEHNTEQPFLIASPEKALCDHISIVDKNIILNNHDLENYLLEDLRLDETVLRKFNLSILQEIVQVYEDPRLHLIYQYIKSRVASRRR